MLVTVATKVQKKSTAFLYIAKRNHTLCTLYINRRVRTLCSTVDRPGWFKQSIKIKPSIISGKYSTIEL